MSEQGSVNRRIAELCGWRIGDYTFRSQGDLYTVKALLKPDGSLAGFNPLSQSKASLEKLWGAYGPDYANSLDAVAAELARKDVRLELDFDTGMATIYDWNEKRMEALESCASSIDKADAVEAAAHALLKWAEARRGEGV